VFTNISEERTASVCRVGDGGSTLENVGNHQQHYMASQPRRPQSTKCVKSFAPQHQNKCLFVLQTGMEADERLYLKLVNGYRMEQPPFATNAM
jgi:hypothetical protein